MFEGILPYTTLQYVILGNTVGMILEALAVFIGVFVVLRIFQVVLLRRLAALARRTETDIDDAVIRVVHTLRPPFYLFIAFYIASRMLILAAVIQQVLDAVLIIWLVYQIVRAIQVIIDYIIGKYAAQESGNTRAAVRLIGRITTGILWVIAALLILSNIGVNITSLVAGLGIGGVAVALALQNILSDLFSSFAIFFDKPFEVGDFIVVGDKMGSVERIGIKTTRIRSLQGEEVVIANQELTSAQVQNFKKMEERRVVIKLGVLYDTPQEKMKRIPGIIEKIIEQENDTRFDRAHFYQFSDSSLDFEIVYFILDPDYNTYMDINERILLEIRDAFMKDDIGMAYPTQTVYLHKQ